uniref:Selenoprotein V n=2 Tax=Canis lupus familiaris TaxID=9615 RepID=A0A8I3N937_CANLF
MNNQARAPPRTSARVLAWVRASTPVRTSIPTPTPAGGPTPIPTLARTLTPVQTPASAWTPNPVQMLTPPRAPVPVPTQPRTPTPIQTYARTPTPVQTPNPIQMPTPPRTPTSGPTLARPPAPLPTSARTPTPVPTLARPPAPLPTPPRTPTPVPTLARSALPLEPPPEPASEPTTASPHQDLSPTPSVKPLPSVTNGFGSTQEPLPDLTPPATDFLGPTLGSTSRADSSATKLTDSTSESVRVPIPGTDPFAATALATSTNTFAPVGESCSVDKIAVRYILLKKSLEQQFPNCLLFEEERAAQATGEFEVFVDGKLVHSKKKGDGFVDEARLQKIMNVIEEEVRKR